MFYNLNGGSELKRAAVFFADGFEEVEALTVVDYLRRADIHVDMISTIDNKICRGAHGIDVAMDKLMDEISDDYDAYIFPGGSDNAASMRQNKKLLDKVKKVFNENKLVCAICASPTVLYEAGLLAGKKITSYPGVFKNIKGGFDYLEEKVVVDGNLITSRGPALTVYFALEIIQALEGEEKRQQIENQILLAMM